MIFQVKDFRGSLYLIATQSPGKWKKHNYDRVAVDSATRQFTVGRKATKRLVEDEYCVGTVDDKGRLKATFMDCHKPCNGNEPCIR